MRRARGRECGRRVTPTDRTATRCDAVDGSAVDAVLDTVSEFATALPPVLSAATTRPYEISAHMNTHLFPGLAQYESIGAHFNVPAVLFATAFTTSVGVLAAWQLWERGFRKLVFPEEELAEAQTNPSPNLVCGVDCGAFPIFTHPKVRTAVTFAERWHHGQYRRTGEPYVTHCVEAALILAAMLPVAKTGACAKKKYVDAIVACVLHDVVDDTECDIVDVQDTFGENVATLVTDVSTLGKLPQILRRSQRRRAEMANNSLPELGTGTTASGSLERDALKRASSPKALKIAETKENFQGVDVAELASLRRMLWSLVSDPRCFLIKFADRIHNMRTVFVVDSVKAQFVANETLQVWCSFAEQLGMFGAKAEMEDLSFAVKVRVYFPDPKTVFPYKTDTFVYLSQDPENFRRVINARYDAWGAGAAEVRKKKMKKLQVTTEDTKDDTVRSVEGFMSSGAEACATHNEQSSEDYVEESDKNKNERAAQLGPWTWEPPTGADLQMFFERISRGENAGTPRDLRIAGRGERRRIAEQDKSRVIAEQARVAALEEERARRAKPTTRCGAFPPTTHRLRDCPYSYQKGRLPVPITTTVRLDYSDCLLIPIPHTHGRETDTFGVYRISEQEELKALLQCVPPFDVLRASDRSVKSAAAAAAATRSADAATAATVAGLGSDAAARGVADAQMGGASLEASLEALRLCRDTTLRSLQLDALAPGLRVDIKGRLKSAYSTHLKMRRKKVGFTQVCDARALRVVVGEPGVQPGTRDEVIACFDLVTAIHKLYRPVPGEYDDYISNPKRSGYQSLHTAVIGPDGALLEFQVRTRAMHHAAEFGDAAHWLYKDFIADAEELEKEAESEKTESKVEEHPDAKQTRAPPAVTVGQPVLIVRDARGDRLAAGVISYTKGTRMHVVEPKRGDAFAPGYANAAGVVDVAEWVAMELHTSLLKRATDCGLTEPRQTGRGYSVFEFLLCADGRWHETDAYGRVMGTTADPLDVESLLAALAKTEEETGEGETTNNEITLENKSGPTSGSQTAPMLASPDDEAVGVQVKAMQVALRAYLDDEEDDEGGSVPELYGLRETETVLDSKEFVFESAGGFQKTQKTASQKTNSRGETPARVSLRVATRDLATTKTSVGSLSSEAAQAVEKARVELRLSLAALVSISHSPHSAD